MTTDTGSTKALLEYVMNVISDPAMLTETKAEQIIASLTPAPAEQGEVERLREAFREGAIEAHQLHVNSGHRWQWSDKEIADLADEHIGTLSHPSSEAIPAGSKPLVRSREWWLERIEQEPDCFIGAGVPDRPDFITAVKRLVVCARTAGGTAGRDEGLMAALDDVEAFFAAAPHGRG